MPKFLVVHPIGKEMPPEGRDIAQAIKANLTTDAYWIRSVYVPEEGKLYCEWDAKDAESIRQVFTKAAPEFPTEGIYKIELMIHSEDYR